jgi:hypothetical protein
MLPPPLKAPKAILLRFALLMIPFMLLVRLGGSQAVSLAANPPATFSVRHDHPNIASLDGLWHFHPGDDFRWASPDFDDSQWPLIRSDRFWTAQGYPEAFG